MEPTADELNQIDTLQAAYDWAGVPEDVRESLKEALGEPSKIRDIIFVARAVWDTIVGRIKGSKPPDADGNRDPRDLTPGGCVQIGNIQTGYVSGGLVPNRTRRAPLGQPFRQ